MTEHVMDHIGITGVSPHKVDDLQGLAEVFNKDFQKLVRGSADLCTYVL